MTKTREDLSSTLNNIPPHLFPLLSKLITDKEVSLPSPLPNRDELTAEIAAIKEKSYAPNLENLLQIFENSMQSEPLASLYGNDLAPRMEVFTNYIKDRWASEGETAESKKTLFLAIFDLLLKSHQCSQDTFTGIFPISFNEDLECLDGTTARINQIIPREKSPLNNLFAAASFSALATACQPLLDTVRAGYQVHIQALVNHYLTASSVDKLKTIDPRAANYSTEIDSRRLLDALNIYEQELKRQILLTVDKSDAEYELDFRGPLLELAEKYAEQLIADPLFSKYHKKLLSLARLEGCKISASDFEIKNKFDESLKRRAELEYGLNSGDLQEHLDKFTTIEEDPEDEENYLLKINTDGLAKIIRALLEKKQLDQLELITKTIGLNEPKSVSTTLDPTICYTRDFHKECVAALSSDNRALQSQIINSLFAFSKKGYGSLALNVFRDDIVEAATKLREKFQEQAKEGDVFCQFYLSRLEPFLERAENAKKYFQRESKTCLSIFNDGDADLTNVVSSEKEAPILDYEEEALFTLAYEDEVPFILANASNEICEKVLSALSHTQALRVLTADNPYSKEFGKGAFFFFHDDLLTSMLLRPNATKMFETLIKTANLKEDKRSHAILALKCLTLAREKVVSEDVMTEIFHDLKPDDEVNLAGNEDFLFRCLAIRKPPIMGGHLLLKLIFTMEHLAIDDNSNTALILAGEYGHVDVAKEIISAAKRAENLPALLTHNRSDGCTALMIAAQNGHIDIIKEIIKAAEEKGKLTEALEQCARDGETALMLAAKNGHANIVREIISAAEKAENLPALLMHSRSSDGLATLVLTATNGHISAVKELIEAAKRVGNLKEFLTQVSSDYKLTALIMATKNGHIDIVKEIIEAAERAGNLPEALSQIDCYGRSALMIAAQNGYADIVKEIIEATERARNLPEALTMRDNTGYTALILSTHNKDNTATVKEIIEAAKKAENLPEVLMSTLPSGHTALMIAAQNGHIDMVKEIIKAAEGVDGLSGALLSNSDDRGHTVLIMAADNGHDSVVREIIEAAKRAGNLPEVLTKSTTYKDAALMMAAQNGYIDIVKEIIKLAEESGNLPEALMKTEIIGFTALMLAAERGHVDVVKEIIEAAERVGNIQDLLLNTDEYEEHETALMIATRKGYLNVVQEIIEAAKRAENLPEVLAKTDLKKRTALMLAEQYDRAEIKNIIDEALNTPAGASVVSPLATNLDEKVAEENPSRNV